MKAQTGILKAFIAISLVIAIAGQVSGEKEARRVEETLAQRQAELADKTDEAAKKAYEASLKAAEAVTRQQVQLALQNAQNLALARAKRGGQNVMVVLTTQIKPEELAAITEDLNIMSRIFDKQLGRALPIRTEAAAYLGDLLRWTKGKGETATDVIYIQGYGALFLTNVDFPLSPPPKVEVEKIEESVDPVWQDTKQEIYMSGQKTLGVELDVEYEYAAAREYDPQTVEELKTKLIQALKHAANIRNLKPEESLILTVAGTQPIVAVAKSGKEDRRRRVISSTGQNALVAPTLLTIRAKKSDIDAHAKGQLDFDQFGKRVQILTSHATLGPVQASEIISLPQPPRPAF